jgi:hypothetical protein
MSEERSEGFYWIDGVKSFYGQPFGLYRANRQR